MSHDFLVSSLERHQRDSGRILFREPNLNGWSMGGEYGSPDLLEIPKSYSRFYCKIYEVKYSQADMLSDLRAGKYERYLPICDRMIFAVSDKCDWKTHLTPLPVGIMVHSDKGWRTVRAAPKNKKAQPWPNNVFMALLFGRMGFQGSTRLERIQREGERLASNELSQIRKTVWPRLSRAAAELDEKETRLKNWEARLNERDKATGVEVRDQLLRDLERKFGIWRDFARQGDTADNIFRKWAGDIVEREMRSLRERLINPEKENE